MRETVSTAQAAATLGIGRRTVNAYLRRSSMPRLEGYAVRTTGPARRVHAHRVFIDSIDALQHWWASDDPLSRARSGLPAA